MLVSKKKLIIYLFVVLICCEAFNPPEVNFSFPVDRFRALSGTFGELRGSHFHGGIDLKVGGRVGAPIHAVENGYIYRMVVSPTGYGNALYIKHPNGQFSVYGHLLIFNDTLQRYIRSIQYQTRTFPQNVYPEKGRFQVRRGEEIGKAGNSGWSFGPHLHFEIRDSLDQALNPLRYVPGEIEDNIKPIVQKIAFEPLDHFSRINKDYRKMIFDPSGGNGQYQIYQPILIRGTVGLEYLGYDLLNAAYNRCGINRVKLFLDDQQIFEFHLDTLNFDQNHFIDRHIDYGYHWRNDQKFQKVYIDSGNQLEAYPLHINQGVISLKDDSLHAVRLELYDGYMNQTVVKLNLQRDTTKDVINERIRYSNRPQLTYKTKRNNFILRIIQPPKAYFSGINYVNTLNEEKIWVPSFTYQNELVFIKPLEEGSYPARILDEEYKLDYTFHFKEEITPNQNHFVRFEDLRIYFPYESVYDCTALEIQPLPRGTNAEELAMVGPSYRIGNAEIPLAKSYWLGFVLPDTLPKDKLGIGQWDWNDKEWEYKKTREGEANNLYTKTSEFSTYALFLDTYAPKVTPLNFKDNAVIPQNQNRLSLRVKDDFSGINVKKINCSIDGAWVLVRYDPRYDILIYEIENRPAKGDHNFHVEVADHLGNITSQSYKIQF